MPSRRATTKGFTRTSALLTQRVRAASEKRGFAQSRLLTHWAEIAGASVAAVSRPVEVNYGRHGMGATLTLLTTGAHALQLDMEKEKLRARVNAVYGYNAIARILITQTAATGFAEGQVDFSQAPSKGPATEPRPEVRAKASEAASPIEDDTLRHALARLGENILNKTYR